MCYTFTEKRQYYSKRMHCTLGFGKPVAVDESTLSNHCWAVIFYQSCSTVLNKSLMKCLRGTEQIYVGNVWMPLTYANYYFSSWIIYNATEYNAVCLVNQHSYSRNIGCQLLVGRTYLYHKLDQVYEISLRLAVTLRACCITRMH